MPRTVAEEGEHEGSEMQELNLSNSRDQKESAFGTVIGAGGKELGDPVVVLEGVQKVIPCKYVCVQPGSVALKALIGRFTVSKVATKRSLLSRT